MLRPGQRTSVVALLVSLHAGATPVRDYPETSSSLPPDEAPAFVYGDLKRQEFYLTTDGTRPLIVNFDLDRIVGDPFTLQPRTLGKIFRLPPRFQLSLARFLADGASRLGLEHPPVGARPETPASVLRLSEDASDGLQDRLIGALSGVFDEYDIIDFGVFVLSRAPFFTLDIWNRIKLTVTRHELVFAIAVALAAMAVEILTDELSAGRSGWFFRHAGSGIRLGWYVQIWDLSLREAPGGAAGLRLGWSRLESKAGLSGDLETGERSLSFEGRLEERWLSKLVEPLGWSLSSGVGVRHRILDEDEEDQGLTTINGSITLREGTGMPRPDGRMLVFGLNGSGATSGAKSGGVSALYGTRDRTASGTVAIGTDAEGRFIYTAFAGWTERGIDALGGSDLGLQLSAMRPNGLMQTEGASLVLTRPRSDLSAILKFGRTVVTSADPSVPPVESWKAGAFVAGSLDGGLGLDDAWIRHKCARIGEGIERIEEARDRVSAIARRIIEGEEVDPREERRETLWLGLYRLRIRDDLAEYASARALFEARRGRDDTRSCVLEPETLAEARAESASDTFGAETHPLYRDGSVVRDRNAGARLSEARPHGWPADPAPDRHSP